MFVEFLTSGDGEKCSVKIDAIEMIYEYNLESLKDKEKEIAYSNHGRKHTAIRLTERPQLLSVVGNYEETMAKINAVIGKTDNKN